MKYLSSSQPVGKKLAFRFIRDLVDTVQANRYDIRIICEYNDILGDQGDRGYIMIDFSEDTDLNDTEIWDRWDFKDPTLVCYVCSAFSQVSDYIDIHSKQTIIKYLYNLWKNGRIYRLYAESY